MTTKLWSNLYGPVNIFPYLWHCYMLNYTMHLVQIWKVKHVSTRVYMAIWFCVTLLDQVRFQLKKFQLNFKFYWKTFVSIFSFIKLITKKFITFQDRIVIGSVFFKNNKEDKFHRIPNSIELSLVGRRQIMSFKMASEILQNYAALQLLMTLSQCFEIYGCPYFIWVSGLA